MPPWVKGFLVALLAGLAVGGAAAAVYLVKVKPPRDPAVISTTNVAANGTAEPQVAEDLPAGDSEKLTPPALEGIRVTVEASDEAGLQLDASFEIIDCYEARTSAATSHTADSRISRVFEFCGNAPLTLVGLAEEESRVVLSAFEDLAANAASGMGDGYSPVQHKLLRARGQAGGQPVTLVVGAVSAELCSDTSCSEAVGTLSIGASLAESGGVSLPVLSPAGGAAAASLL